MNDEVKEPEPLIRPNVEVVFEQVTASQPKPNPKE
jgi:hypothetical protein